MPFPLSHPAAILPLRRVRQLNFAALVIGSITPDLSYCLERYDIDLLAHSLRGCLLFSLPVGWLLVGVFRAISQPLVDLLPSAHRRALQPACHSWDQPWFAVPVSVVIGAATHVVFDAFTHETGWWVERSSFLQWKLFSVAGHRFQVFRLLWHLASWTGLFLLWRTYRRVLRAPGAAPRTAAETATDRHRYALWLGLLLPPLVPSAVIAYAHYAARFPSLAAIAKCLRLAAAIYLVLVSLALIAGGAAMKLRRGPGPFAGDDRDAGAGP